MLGTSLLEGFNAGIMI